MTTAPLFFTGFLACVVEAVEVTTSVLAACTTRDWRSSLFGVGSGIGVLAVLLAVLGPAVSSLRLGALRLVVGGPLLIFGLQWLRKAIPRAGGYKSLHEAEIYRDEVTAARAAAQRSRGGVSDWYAFSMLTLLSR
jgi:uncharacterized membrane protein